jgi:type 1 glutamine amidotransferase
MFSPTGTFAVKPIRILLISGGCCHDYYFMQNKILIDSVNKYVPDIEWNCILGDQAGTNILPILKQKDYTYGYDLVIYNTCWADVKDTAYINNICRNHRNGVNAVVLHCAMHTFRDAGDEEWKKFLGMDSHNHGSRRIFSAINVNPKHPVMKFFPAKWTTPVEEELYVINRELPTAIPLAKSLDTDNGKEYTTMWVNTYGKSQIIGTTIGHTNNTFQDHDYIMFLARSIQWLCHRLDENGNSVEKE